HQQAFERQAAMAVEVLAAKHLTAPLAIAQLVEQGPGTHAGPHPLAHPGQLQPATPEHQTAALGAQQQTAPAHGLLAALAKVRRKTLLGLGQHFQLATLTSLQLLGNLGNLALQQALQPLPQGLAQALPIALEHTVTQTEILAQLVRDDPHRLRAATDQQYALALQVTIQRQSRQAVALAGARRAGNLAQRITRGIIQRPALRRAELRRQALRRAD